MTGKQKAEELVNYYKTKCDGIGYINQVLAIECALFTVDEIWVALNLEHATGHVYNFWSNVKFELEEML